MVSSAVSSRALAGSLGSLSAETPYRAETHRFRSAWFAHCSLVVSSAPDETSESLLLQQFPMVVVRAAVLLYEFRAAARPAAVKEVA
jgi:hypothetical protein